MNVKGFLIQLIICLLIVIVISGCGTTQELPAPVPPTATPELEPVEPTAKTKSQPVVEITFNGDECNYSGPDSFPQGKVSVIFINQSEAEAGFGLIQLTDGNVWDDFLEFLGPPGSEHSGPPQWGEAFDIRTTGAGETQEFSPFLMAEEYGLYCIMPKSPNDKMWAGAPFTVEK